MNAPSELQIVDMDPVVDQPAPVPATQNQSASLMLAMVQRGATPEQLEKMMELLERQDRREVEQAKRDAEKAFREDFAAFRGENIIIPKTKHVDRGRGGSFDQAEYDEVCRRLSPALSRHGFSFRHDQRFGTRRWMTDGTESDIGWVWVTCHLEHRRGHSESLELEGPPGELTVNTPTQNMQTTASYLKRQSLLAITGTATGGEDDESKMRGRTGARNERPEIPPELLQAARDEALKGWKAFAAWIKGRTEEERNLLDPESASLKQAAREADAANGGAQ